MTTRFIDWFLGKLSDLFFYVISTVWEKMMTLGQAVMTALLDGIAAIGIPGWDQGTLQPYFDMANYLFPLQESFGLFAGLYALWQAVWFYRLAKSWLPSFSGG